MILERGRKYRLRDKYAKTNIAGKVVVNIIDHTDGIVVFSAEDGVDYYRESPAVFCQYFEEYNPMPMKFIYKHRTSTFKPR